MRHIFKRMFSISKVVHFLAIAFMSITIIPVVHAEMIKVIGPNGEVYSSPRYDVEMKSANSNQGRTATAVKKTGEEYYGPSRSDDTLWSIATRLRPSNDVSIQQTLLAIYQLNPQAFDEQNIHSLNPGSLLRIPSLAQVRRNTTAEAVQLMALHQSRLNEQPTAKLMSTDRGKPANVKAVKNANISVNAAKHDGSSIKPPQTMVSQNVTTSAQTPVTTIQPSQRNEEKSTSNKTAIVVPALNEPLLTNSTLEIRRTNGAESESKVPDNNVTSLTKAHVDGNDSQSSEISDLEEKNLQLRLMLADVQDEVKTLKAELNDDTRLRHEMDKLLAEQRHKQAEIQKMAPTTLDTLLSKWWVVASFAIIPSLLLGILLVLLFRRRFNNEQPKVPELNQTLPPSFADEGFGDVDLNEDELFGTDDGLDDPLFLDKNTEETVLSGLDPQDLNFIDETKKGETSNTDSELLGDIPLDVEPSFNIDPTMDEGMLDDVIEDPFADIGITTLNATSDNHSGAIDIEISNNDEVLESDDLAVMDAELSTTPLDPSEFDVFLSNTQSDSDALFDQIVAQKDEEDRKSAENVELEEFELLDEQLLDDDELLGDELLGDELLGDELLGDELLGDELLGDELLSDELLGDELLGDELLSDELLDEQLLDESLDDEWQSTDQLNENSVELLDELLDEPTDESKVLDDELAVDDKLIDDLLTDNLLVDELFESDDTLSEQEPLDLENSTELLDELLLLEESEQEESSEDILDESTDDQFEQLISDGLSTNKENIQPENGYEHTNKSKLNVDELDKSTKAPLSTSSIDKATRHNQKPNADYDSNQFINALRDASPKMDALLNDVSEENLQDDSSSEIDFDDEPAQSKKPDQAHSVPNRHATPTENALNQRKSFAETLETIHNESHNGSLLDNNDITNADIDLAPLSDQEHKQIEQDWLADAVSDVANVQQDNSISDFDFNPQIESTDKLNVQTSELQQPITEPKTADITAAIEPVIPESKAVEPPQMTEAEVLATSKNDMPANEFGLPQDDDWILDIQNLPEYGEDEALKDALDESNHQNRTSTDGNNIQENAEQDALYDLFATKSVQKTNQTLQALDDAKLSELLDETNENEEARAVEHYDLNSEQERDKLVSAGLDLDLMLDDEEKAVWDEQSQNNEPKIKKENWEEQDELAEYQPSEEQFMTIDELMAQVENDEKIIDTHSSNSRDGLDLDSKALELEESPELIDEVEQFDEESNAEAIEQLDLAKIYIDMRDIDGAKKLLNDAIVLGNKETQDEAKQLLAQIT